MNTSTSSVDSVEDQVLNLSRTASNGAGGRHLDDDRIDYSSSSLDGEDDNDDADLPSGR